MIKKKSEINIVNTKPIVLSAKNAKRYEKMVDEVLSGKVKTKKYTDVDKMMDDLMK